VQTDVVFAPDISDDLKLTVLGFKIDGGGFQQRFKTTGGQAIGWYPDGTVSAVENSFGKGKTLLIGTYPSLGFYNHHGEATRQFFRQLLNWSGMERRVAPSNGNLIVRLHKDGPKTLLWVLNPTRSSQASNIDLPLDKPKAILGVRWGRLEDVSMNSGRIGVTVPARNALVVELE
jgi:beta-galactosidase